MPDDAIKDQVKEATDIVAVIGQYVTLRRRGANLIGLCPFHTEKTPSFTVHADRQFFHCFGCGKGGDVFTFLMEHEGWSFPEALKYCAEKAGITLPERRERDDPQSRLRDEMSAALELADKIFRHTLFTPVGKHALDYLKNRGFQEQTLKRAGIGYAPPGYETVLKTAEARGITRKTLEAAGLITHSAKGGNPYDRFRNRVTFPIVNLSGKTVGFGARALSDEDQPKYLNSPETALYQKGRLLYGLVVARDAIRRENRAILVEGYMDWLTMVEAGIENVVAVSGTALTDMQAKLLSRFCERVTMMFDADAAGQRAALRGIDIAYNAALGVDIAVLPKGEDPDSLIRKQGGEALRRVLNAAVGIVEYRVENERAKAPGGRLDFLAQEKLIKEFGELAAKLADPTRREAFLAEVAATVGVEMSVVRQALKLAPAPRPPKAEAPPRELLSGHAGFLRLLLESPDYVARARVAVLADDFDHPLLRAMYQALLDKTADGSWPTTPQELGATSEEVEHWSRLMTHGVDPATRDRAFEDGLRDFAQRRRPAPQLRQLIAQAERAGETAKARELTEKLADELRLDKTEPAEGKAGKGDHGGGKIP
jgi:DNA primase